MVKLPPNESLFNDEPGIINDPDMGDLGVYFLLDGSKLLRTVALLELFYSYNNFQVSLPPLHIILFYYCIFIL